ncbi:hypothetical protein [Compostibacter hankyongensis]|uniref:Uncharacterized protein n=1 Tax=Compostibacter hankyongensis TaxID=1007089 RepID=A0ABP8G5S3_9BACT
MKPRTFTAVLLFISAYSPLFLILAVRDFDFREAHRFGHPLPVLLMLGVTLLSIVLLFATVAGIQRGNMSVTVVSVRNRSVDVISYTIPYMISFFGVSLSDSGDVISLLIFLLILLLLTITSQSVFINPLLSLAGYGLYDLEYLMDGRQFSTVVISRYALHPGRRYYLRSLTRFLYFVTEKQEQDNVP